MEWNLCHETLLTNVVAFTAITNIVYERFRRHGAGHVAAIASISGLRGAENDSGYSASKAYMIRYLEGMARKARHDKCPMTLSTILPGFVNTRMGKGDKFFWMCSPQEAARQIVGDLARHRRYSYVTRRWRPIAWLLKALPTWLYERM